MVDTFGIYKIEEFKNSKAKKEGFQFFSLASTARTHLTPVELKGIFEKVCRGDFFVDGLIVGTGDVYRYE